jgi:beta-galactosidase/beta-glucuronidase
MINRWLFSLFCVPSTLAFAGTGGLTDKISLNGIWDFTPKGGSEVEIAVPEFWDARPGFDTDSAVYHRKVTVPTAWQGNTILLRFEGINHIAEVFVNGQHVASHVGGWIPFSIDITSRVNAGETFDLKVDVKGGKAFQYYQG